MLLLFTHYVDSFETPWTVAHQAPLSMGFPRQEHWSGLPFSPPGDRPHPEMESRLLHWQADSLTLSHLGSPYTTRNIVIALVRTKIFSAKEKQI